MHAKFEVAGFICYGNMRQFVFERQIRFFGNHLGVLLVMYGLHLQLVGKRVVDFLFAIIELFWLALMADALVCRNPFVEGGGSFWV